jgi:hypothetical protein
MLLVLWTGAMLGGALAAWRVRAQILDHPVQNARVMGSMEDQGLPGHVRDGVGKILEANLSAGEAVFAASLVIAALGLLGIVGEVTALRLTRRLLQALVGAGGPSEPAAEGGPGPRG